MSTVTDLGVNLGVNLGSETSRTLAMLVGVDRKMYSYPTVTTHEATGFLGNLAGWWTCNGGKYLLGFWMRTAKWDGR